MSLFLSIISLVAALTLVSKGSWGLGLCRGRSFSLVKIKSAKVFKIVSLIFTVLTISLSPLLLWSQIGNPYSLDLAQTCLEFPQPKDLSFTLDEHRIGHLLSVSQDGQLKYSQIRSPYLVHPESAPTDDPTTSWIVQSTNIDIGLNPTLTKIRSTLTSNGPAFCYLDHRPSSAGVWVLSPINGELEAQQIIEGNATGCDLVETQGQLWIAAAIDHNLILSTKSLNQEDTLWHTETLLTDEADGYVGLTFQNQVHQ